MTEVPNKQRLANAELRLDQVETALGLQPPKPKSAFRKFREHLSQQVRANWKAILPVVAIAVAIIGWFVGPLFKGYLEHRKEGFNADVDGRIQAELNKPDGVIKRLENIQDTTTRTEATLTALQPFIQDVIKREFESASNISSVTLRDHLPAVQHLIVVADAEHVQIDPHVIRRLGQHLSEVQLNNQQSPQVWPVVSKFINYKSDALVPDSSKILASVGSRKCTMRPIFPYPEFQFSDCELALDELPTPEETKGFNTHYIFVNSVVTYSGGHIYASALTFKNCIFRFQVPTTPQPRGILAMQQLIAAQDQANIQLSFPSA